MGVKPGVQRYSPKVSVKLAWLSETFLGSMGLVYLPTWMVDFLWLSCRYIYTIRPMDPSWVTYPTLPHPISTLYSKDGLHWRSPRLRCYLTMGWGKDRSFEDGTPPENLLTWLAGKITNMFRYLSKLLYSDILGVGFPLHKPYPYSVYRWVPPF